MFFVFCFLLQPDKKKKSTQFGKFHKTIDSKHNYVICLQKKQCCNIFNKGENIARHHFWPLLYNEKTRLYMNMVII